MGHRFTGITMTVGLYAISIGLFAAPDTIPHYVDMLSSMNHGALIWFPAKTIVASTHFPCTELRETFGLGFSWRIQSKGSAVLGLGHIWRSHHPGYDDGWICLL